MRASFGGRFGYVDDGETATLTQRVTRKGSDRIVRYAFDLARRVGRKKGAPLCCDRSVVLDGGLRCARAR